MSMSKKYSEEEKHISKRYSSIKQRDKDLDKHWGRKKFIEWYKTYKKCYICGITKEESKKFRVNYDKTKRKRGYVLEIDKKESKQRYTEGNCGLICYWCNNAKSDVFSPSEFKPIGRQIGRVIKNKPKQKSKKNKAS